MRFFIFLVATIALLMSARAGYAGGRYCEDDGSRTLRVEMYPFVPNAEGMAFTIKEQFEQGCPGLNLELVMDQNYYSSDDTGILAADADVYEVDSVFIADFIKQRNPKAASATVLSAAGPAVPFAKEIATRNGTQIGVPHWICSDFLIFPKDLTQLAGLKSPADAVAALKRTGKGLLMDLEGSSTLGELYLSILVAHYGSVPDALKHLDPDHIDDYAISVLRNFLTMEEAGLGRDKDYHSREGFYPRLLARRKGSAYVGYSEDTYYALSESSGSCLKNECLREEDLDVAAWPFADQGAKPVAWVDMYLFDAKLEGVRLRDAEAFVRFMMSPTAYKMLLLPPDSPPRYLLPARSDIYADGAMERAKLYSKFWNLVKAAVPVTGDNLNSRLREVAARIEQQGLLDPH